MFGLGTATKVYIALEPVDMRKGFEGLHGLVRDHLGEDPLNGHLFLFSNRAHTRLKALLGMAAACGSAPSDWNAAASTGRSQSKASDRVVIETVVSKYCDHLPLFRQAAILGRERRSLGTAVFLV
jgi:transposase